jgi:hypothetical protein
MSDKTTPVEPGHKVLPPLPPEVTLEVIKNANPETIRFWIRTHGAKALNDVIFGR